MSRIKALLLDFDGTLLDSVREAYSATRSIFVEFNVEPPNLEEYCTHMRHPFEAFYQQRGVPLDKDEIWNKFLQRFDQSNVAFFPDVEPFFKAAVLEALPVGIATASAEKSVLKRCGENQWFACISFVACRQYDKTESVKQFADLHDLQCAEVALVGDICDDMVCAKKAGARAVGISRGEINPQILYSAGADICISSLLELLALCRV